MGHRNEFDSFRDLFLTNESSDLLLEEAPRLCIFIRSMRFSFVCLGFFVRGWFGFSIVLSRRKDSKWAPTNKFTRLYWVWLSVTGFYWVLLGFTGFYRVLRNIIQWNAIVGPDSVVVSRRKDSKWAPTNKFTWFHWVLLGFYRVLLRLTGFHWVLLSFTGFYWVLLGFTGFY